MFEVEKGNRVIFASGGYSYLSDMFKNQLETKACEVISLNAQSSLITITDSVDGIVIYCSGKVLEDTRLLVYLKDIAEGNRIPLFVIADKLEMEVVKTYIPDVLITKTYEHPVNTREASAEIIQVIKHELFVAKKKILAIDDNATILRTLQEWLGNNYHVAVATSGINAMKQLGISKPDLILLDYEMPVCNGRQVLQMIRADEDCKNIPIVFYTNHADASDTIDIMQYGVQGYILKSLPAKDIIMNIERVLHQYA